ncbi:MAG TPA: glucose-6-phosphate isomerase [Spirochaetota bacterium]|nr:glucose-6-phosphate isomerase [Spirochaetota bacterium]HOM86631.1 glucose-6-phosphate isomerase [Spirochaetota bacterium]HOR95029.1 glucose-6-phosphate isomerase [Spirochaetota bacterium]HPK45440.1 glucose-6-phosphate isomerase [Spirochaetota bacterium]
MMIRFDYNYFMDEHIGTQHGLSQNDIDGIRPEFNEVLKRMDDEKAEGLLGFLEIPFNTSLVKDIQSFRQHTDWCDTIALIGIGGSALGPQALKNALADIYWNELPDEKRGKRCKVYFFDNVDPIEMNSLLDIINIPTTLFLVISKSGGTTETNANFAILLDTIKKNTRDYKKHIVTITDPAKGIMRQITREEGFTSFPIPANVGGRFSVLTAVGLVMAEFIGIDINGLLHGAAEVIDRYYGKEVWSNAPLLNAAFHYCFDVKKNKRINVLMPYTRKLFLFADWFRQLWAESLGKRFDIYGNEVMVGLTPVAALGTVDQHSQLQLYLEGPNDKVITFLKLQDFGTDITIPEFYKGKAELDYLSGKSLRKLNGFEEQATELVLKEASRPNASIILPELDERSAGQLIMFLEMQTAYAGYLYNINPYDQPAVEQGKRFTFGLLHRPGYDEYEQKFKSGYQKKENYIL